MTPAVPQLMGFCFLMETVRWLKKKEKKVLQLTIIIMGPELVICSIVVTDSGLQPSVCNKQCSAQLSDTVTHTVFNDTVTHTVFNDTVTHTVFNDTVFNGTVTHTVFNDTVTHSVFNDTVTHTVFNDTVFNHIVTHTAQPQITSSTGTMSYREHSYAKAG